MDRRTQRALLLALFFAVAYLLYTTAGTPPVLWPASRNGSSNAWSAINAGPALDLKGLTPANSTLGVSLIPLNID